MNIPEIQCLPRVLMLFLIGVCATLGADAGDAEPAPAPPVTIVAFGDSLTAGYMLPSAAAFPSQLEVALAAKGYKVQVVNAGVSGDTAAAGLERLEWTFQGGADAAIVELGANDALRGNDPKITRDVLDRILGTLRAKGVDVLLAGMRAPGNWGVDYQTAFDAMYPDLAAKHGTLLYPFFLDGVALDPALVQVDGLHPTEKGVSEIVRRILPKVESLLKRVDERKAAKGN